MKKYNKCLVAFGLALFLTLSAFSASFAQAVSEIPETMDFRKEMFKSIVIVEATIPLTSLGVGLNKPLIGRASGVIIDIKENEKTVYVLLVHHLINFEKSSGSADISVIIDDKKYKSQILDSNGTIDALILKVVFSAKDFPEVVKHIKAIAINDKEGGVSTFEDVFVAGFYRELPLISEGYIAGARTVTVPDPVDESPMSVSYRLAIFLNRFVGPGMSGGAVLNQNLKLVGIITEMDEDAAGQLAFATSVASFQKWVKETVEKDAAKKT